MATVTLDLNFDLFFCDGIDEVYVAPVSSYRNRYVRAKIFFPIDTNLRKAKEIIQEVKDEINEQSW